MSESKSETNPWNPKSWQQKPALQQPAYPDADALDRVVDAMSKLPPLVTSWEVEALKGKLAKAAKGEMFLLQGGDCAESFEACDSGTIASTLKILLQMSLILVHATRKGVIRVGRIAGQYAKPRSNDVENRDGATLPSYRGDLVNRSPFTPADRIPNPELLLRGYERSALTLNFIRALADGGFADLHHPENWNLSFVKHSKLADDYNRIADSIKESVEFMEAISGVHFADMDRVNFYTSHEGLSLHYEQAQTRQVPRRTGFYNLSTHFPWIGMRTAKADGAHVEYFRGLCNPVAVKVGPGMTSDWINQLLDILHPNNEPGRLTFIHRFGAAKIDECLPPILETIKKSGKTVLWVCDAMHGNTETTEDGIKTRRFDNILHEIERAFEIHNEMGTILGGIHFELTGKNVTECIGGARDLKAEDLKRAYQSQVDPRLNYEQSLEMAMLVARHLRHDKT